MRYGKHGTYGSPGNQESATYRFQIWRVGSNPTDGTRIDRYADSNEICEQRLVLRTDPDIIYVFIGPHVATLTYAPHAWRRHKSVSASKSPRASASAYRQTLLVGCG